MRGRGAGDELEEGVVMGKKRRRRGEEKKRTQK
jgi:hypothetical protein